MPATLADLVTTSSAIRSTQARLEKRAHLRRLFQRLERDELCLAASYLAGEVPQGRVQVGWRALADALHAADRGDDLPLFAAVQDAAAPRSPTLQELDRTLSRLHEIAGPGSARQRLGVLRTLLEPLDESQRGFIQGLFLGELRQGALRAIVVEALAETFDVEIDALRRAVMFAGALDEVVEALSRAVAGGSDTASRDCREALAVFGPRHGVPIEPMLAASAEDAREALESFGGRAALEWKLDGVRVQVHRHGDDVRVFSRRLRDVTALAPEAVALARELGAQSFILDGELIGLDAQGRPVPFQDFMSRFSRQEKSVRAAPSRSGAADAPIEIERVETRFFDVLELDGHSWVEAPYAARRSALEQLVPAAHRVPQQVVSTVEAAQSLFEAARGAGHEGVVIKQLDAPYTAGRRGSAWRKVKSAETLDLVILAAEWGHGRRKGLLSNLHLGARDADDSGRFHMLGKTFKGLTDVMLNEMTQDLLAIQTERRANIVFVQPTRVVEVAFDAVQRSRRYDSGFALRFARVKRFRPDKSVEHANTLEDVRRIFAAQHGARRT
jgi:DNA ligase-1